MDGYVSFATIEGLGAPPGFEVDEDGPEDEAARRGLRGWWKVWSGGARSGSGGGSGALVAHSR